MNNADYDIMNAAVANRDSSLSEESISEQGCTSIQLKSPNKYKFCNEFHFFFIEDSYRSDSNRPKKTRKKKPIDRLDEKLTVNIIYLVE